MHLQRRKKKIPIAQIGNLSIVYIFTERDSTDTDKIINELKKKYNI
jgi:hypothetical protein